MKQTNLIQTFLQRVCIKKILRFIKTFVLLAMIVNINLAWANAEELQGKKVTGTITDAKTGEALPGVNIRVQNTSTGTISDVAGKYTIDVPNADAVLVFSFIGYVEQAITVGNQSAINVSLNEELTALSEVVVVGYGTQAKVNLTGSVGAVKGVEITKRVTPNVQNMLEGRVSGLQVVQRGGEPGNDIGSMRIRGIGTFSGTGSDPLVLIDGIQGNINYLDPDNIEGISVLKDAASAAIYGARAANGVVLVTTKRGKAGDVNVEYHVTLSAQNPTQLPDLLYNSAQYMELWNVANLRAGMTAYFSQAEIDAFKNNTNDPIHYPNFNWIDHCYKTGFMQNHHLSINGGNERTRFNVSVGYLGQTGIVDLFDFKRYNMAMNIDTKVNHWLTIGGNIQVLKSDKVADVQSQYSEAYFIMHTFGPGPNYTPTMTLPDGTTGYVARYKDYGEWTVRNPDAMIFQGQNDNGRYYTAPQIYADVKLTKDLTWYTKGAVFYDYNFQKNHEHEVNCYNFKDGSFAHNGAVWHLGVIDDMYTTFNTTLYSTLNYKKTIATDHHLNVLAGYDQETSYSRQLGGSKVTFPTYTLYELNAGSATGQTTRGTASEWAIQSLFGRLNYDFRGKYLFEANVRYDGTSRIAPDTRWGVFPSVSAAWRLSEEAFMKGISWLDNLKVRGSWGQLGNQNVGTYPYQDVLSATQYPFGTLEAGQRQTRMTDKTLQWETTTVTDIGLDASIKNGLFSMTVDWYDKLTDGILYQIPIPLSIGLSAPTVNGGQMKNTGWDFEFGHANKIGAVRYDVNLNVSFFKNEVVHIISPTLAQNTVQEGIPYNSWYMIEWEGIFQNQAEIDAAPTHQFNPKPGDLKYKDANGDGKIDSKDRVVVPGYYPDFYYGGGFNVGWKGIDLSVFLNGVQGTKNYVTNWGITPFTQGSPPPMDLVKNAWTGDGSTNKYPAMYRSGYNPVTGTTNTYWLSNSSYLRVKNLRIGYSIPTEFAKKIGMKEAQVYFSGDNLFTFTKYPGSDPERTTSGALSIYPNLRTLAFGIKVTL
jgi:TonB-linked SusC/RagA family outer membrane protein